MAKKNPTSFMDGPSASNSATAFCIGMNFILGAEGGGGGEALA